MSIFNNKSDRVFMNPLGIQLLGLGLGLGLWLGLGVGLGLGLMLGLGLKSKHSSYVLPFNLFIFN
jgi:hypothetical protein